MTFFYCLLFFGISWSLIKTAFKYAIYLQDFIFITPLIVGLGVLTGYALDFFNLNQFFLWYLGLIILFLIEWYIEEKKQVAFAKEALLSYEDGIKATQLLKKREKYFILSSMVYILPFVVTFFIFIKRS